MQFLKKRKIQKLKESGDVAGLLVMLANEKDSQISQLIALTIGQCNYHQTIELLHHTLKQGPLSLREAAVKSVAFLDAAQAIPILTSALQDHAQPIRNHAMQLLGKIGNGQAVQILLSVLQQQTLTDDYQVALQALTAIAKRMDQATCHASIIEPLGLLLKNLRQPLSDTGFKTLEWMGWTLNSDQGSFSQERIMQHQKNLRIAILEAVTKMGWTPDHSSLAAEYWIWRDEWERCIEIGEPAVDTLIAVFKEHDVSVRQRAYDILVQIGTPASQQLIEALKDDYSEMRMSAFRALVKIGHPAVPEMIAALKSEFTDIRLAAVRELKQFDHTQVIKPLIEALADTNYQVRKEAYQSLLDIGPPAIKWLLAAMRHSRNQEIRWGSANVLETLNWQPTADEFGASYWIVRSKWDRCVQIGQPAILPLIEMLEHWDENMRFAAMKTLMLIGISALGPFVKSFKARPPEIRQSFILFLHTLMNEPAVFAIHKQIERMLLFLLHDEEDDQVIQAISALLGTIQKMRKQRERKEQPTDWSFPAIKPTTVPSSPLK